MRRDERRRESKPRERRTVVNGSRRHREGDAKVVYRYTYPTGTRFRLERAPRLGVRTALLSALSRRREVHVSAFRDGHHARLPLRGAPPREQRLRAPPSRTILETSSKTATSLARFPPRLAAASAATPRTATATSSSSASSSVGASPKSCPTSPPLSVFFSRAIRRTSVSASDSSTPARGAGAWARPRRARTDRVERRRLPCAPGRGTRTRAETP